jgi:hypothetical protein
MLPMLVLGCKAWAAQELHEGAHQPLLRSAPVVAGLHGRRACQLRNPSSKTPCTQGTVPGCYAPASREALRTEMYR